MKSVHFFLFCLLAPSILFGANPVKWSELNAISNNILGNISIVFETPGVLSNQANETLYVIQQNDVVRIKKNASSATLTIGNQTKEISLRNDQFVLKFNAESRSFTFKTEIVTTITQSTVDDGKLSTIYHDAALIVRLQNSDPCACQKILMDLGVLPTTSTVYLRPFFQASCNSVANASATQKKGLLGTLGGLDVTKYADGLARFLVKRAKTELTITYFEKFYEELKKLPQLQKLFPETYATLLLIDKEIYYYERYLLMLRENYQTDFNHLPEHLKAWIQEDLTVDVRTKSAFLLASDLIFGLAHQEHIGSIIHSIDKTIITGFDPEVQNVIVLAQHLSESLRDSVTSNRARYWVKEEQILLLTKEQGLRKIFLGLLLESLLKNGHTTLYNSLNVEDKLNSLNAVFVAYAQITQRVSSLIEHHDQEKQVSLESISNYIDAGLEFFESVKNQANDLNLVGMNNTVGPIFDCLKATLTLYKNITQRNFSAALANVVLLMEMIKPGTQQEHKKWLMKYGSFMAAMIDAKQAEDVEKVIESYALPQGSARLKRHASFDVSLNAYLGLYGGYENNSFVSGLATPIGIALSTSGKCGSVSLFMSLIDIGAISALRFNNDSAQIATIYLKEIFSPGMFFSYGFPKAPLSINLGFQQAPLLKRVGNGSNEVDLTYRTRWSLGLLVDVPLWNVSHKSK